MQQFGKIFIWVFGIILAIAFTIQGHIVVSNMCVIVGHMWYWDVAFLALISFDIACVAWFIDWASDVM